MRKALIKKLQEIAFWWSRAWTIDPGKGDTVPELLPVITGLEWILSPEVEPTTVGIKSINKIIKSANFNKSNNKSELILNVSHGLTL